MNNSLHKAQIINFLIDNKMPVSNIEFAPVVSGENYNYEKAKMIVTIAVGKKSNHAKIKITIGDWFEVESFDVCGSKNISASFISRANNLVTELNKLRREFYAQHGMPNEPF